MDINTLTGRRTLSQQHLHAQLAVNIDQEKLFAALDADPNLAGAGVVYVDSKLTAVTHCVNSNRFAGSNPFD